MSARSTNSRGGARRNGGQREGGKPEDSRDDALLARGAGYTIFSTLIAGMIAYGGIGWLIGRAVHIQMLFPIGMLVGLAISLGWIIYRYGIKGGER
jgi:ATP synthase protein I